MAIEPRFRGMEVVAPTEAAEAEGYFRSRVLEQACSIVFQTCTTGNPNNSTPAMQGVCLHVEVPAPAVVQAVFDGKSVRWPIEALIQGARTGQLGNIDSPAWRFHRAIRWNINGTGPVHGSTKVLAVQICLSVSSSIMTNGPGPRQSS